MTKKHFIALADAIRAIRPFQNEGDTYGFRQWKETVEALADFCAAQNPLFNRQRWLDYVDGKCGPGGGAVK